MTIRVSIQRRSLVIGLLIICLLSAGLAAAWLINKPKQTQAEFYTDQLGHLKTGLESVESSSKQKPAGEAMKDHVGQYESNLQVVLDKCDDIGQRYDKIKGESEAESAHSLMDQTDKLCSDLEKVIGYAIEQSTATQEFLLVETASKEDLMAVQKTLDKTESELQKLKQHPINDPAVSEQLSLIDQLAKLSKEAKADPAKLDALSRQIQTHQANILNTRTYYWTNTIDIAAAARSISRLQEQFTQLR